MPGGPRPHGLVFDEDGHFVDNPYENAQQSKQISEWRWVAGGLLAALVLLGVVVASLSYVAWFVPVIFFALFVVWGFVWGLPAWFGNRK